MNVPRKEWLLDRILSPSTAYEGPVGRTVRFFVRDIWRVEPEGMAPVRRVFYRVCRIGFLTFRGFAGDRVFSRASALTYITALSIIPMLALAFSVLKGFGVYGTLVDERIRPSLARHLGPAAGPGEVATQTQQLRAAIEQILVRIEGMDFGSLGAIGLLIVIWAAMRLLGSVEGAFNEIWGVKKARTLVRRLSDYLAIVIVTPILLALTTLGQVRAALTYLETDLGLGPVIEALVFVAPFLGAWAALTFVYLALPNTRTRVLSSVIGGFVAAVLWVIALGAHAWLQLGVAKYNAFYAGFAAIPVFLVWVQVSWVIVLLGGELAFAHEHEPAYRGLASQRELGHASKKVVALRALARITRAFLDGAPRQTTATVAAELGVSPSGVEDVLRTLEAADLVVRTDEGEDSGDGFVLARDPETVTVKRVLDALEEAAPDEVVPPRSAADEEIARLFAHLDEELAGSAYNLDLRELARRAERREADARTEALEQPGVQPS